MQIDDIAKLTDSTIAVASERFLFVLNAASGEIQNKIDTKMRDSERVECTSMTLLVHGDYLFLFSYKDCRMQIWNKFSVDKIRTIDGVKQGWQFANKRPKQSKHHIFVPISLREYTIGFGAMLVIDARDIHAEVQVESGPDFTFSVPSKESPSRIEISVEHKDWGDMLRFLEREAFGAVLVASGDEICDFFSPREVHLNYSGYSASTDLIKQKLDIFKNRFERYIQEPLIIGIRLENIEFSYDLS
jgi:hypothetical protein